MAAAPSRVQAVCVSGGLAARGLPSQTPAGHYLVGRRQQCALHLDCEIEIMGEKRPAPSTAMAPFDAPTLERLAHFNQWAYDISLLL